jgi:hypothetical protein
MSANIESRRRRTLAKFRPRVSRRIHSKRLFDKTMEIAEDAARQRCGGLHRRTF